MMFRVPLVCATCLPVFCCSSSFLFVCLAGLYAGHPYIHLFIILLALLLRNSPHERTLVKISSILCIEPSSFTKEEVHASMEVHASVS